jgi:fumarate hydratase, class II
VDGIEANRENCERYGERTLSAATAPNPRIGYDKATEIVREAAASGRPLREVAREAGVERATRGATVPQKGIRPFGVRTGSFAGKTTHDGHG